MAQGLLFSENKKGWEVFLSDKSPLKEVYKKELDAKGIRWEEGQHTESEILSADCIIKSPGIPHKVPIVQQAKAKGIEIISEIEFASRYTDAKIIAITREQWQDHHDHLGIPPAQRGRPLGGSRREYRVQLCPLGRLKSLRNIMYWKSVVFSWTTLPLSTHI